MVRFICTRFDNGDAMLGSGGPTVLEHKTFTDSVVMEAWLKSTVGGYGDRRCVGVEIVDEPTEPTL